MPQIRRKGITSTLVVADDDPRLTSEDWVVVDLPRAEKGATAPNRPRRPRRPQADTAPTSEPADDAGQEPEEG